MCLKLAEATYAYNMISKNELVSLLDAWEKQASLIGVLHTGIDMLN
jgi:hypothetical protein